MGGSWVSLNTKTPTCKPRAVPGDSEIPQATLVFGEPCSELRAPMVHPLGGFPLKPANRTGGTCYRNSGSGAQGPSKVSTLVAHKDHVPRDMQGSACCGWRFNDSQKQTLFVNRALTSKCLGERT